MIKKNKFKYKKILKRIIKLFILYCFISISVRTYKITIDNFKKSKELRNLEKKLEHNICENQKLKQQLDQGLTNEYVQKRARNDLNMVSPYERVFYNVPLEQQ